MARGPESYLRQPVIALVKHGNKESASHPALTICTTLISPKKAKQLSVALSFYVG